jgi:predicted phage-related endonuclease
VSVTYHRDLIQGSDEWLAARCGLLTASEMKLILTPTLKVADNDKCRAHVWEIMAQRATQHVEPHYISDDMLRGQEDEIEARALYARHYSPVDEVGFITRSFGGFRIGYSPDGLIGANGLIECKSRRQKFQAETLVTNEIPDEFTLQIQTGLLVTGREWLDFVSYSGGMPLCVIRAHPDQKIQDAILAAAIDFEAKVETRLAHYRAGLAGAIMTQRRIEQEIYA